MDRLPVPLLPRAVRWLVVAVAAAAVFYASVLTVPPADPVAPKPDPLPLDKWRHFLGYGALAATLAYATADWEWSTPRVAALVVLAPAAYGAGLEVWQSFLPARYFGVTDAYANAIGAALALPAVALRRRVDWVPARDLLGSGRD